MDLIEMVECVSCGETKAINDFPLNNTQFVKNGKTYQYSFRKRSCKKCKNSKQSILARSFKQECVDYKGGVCVDCGYNNHSFLSVFDFHHKNPSEKEFSIAQYQRWSLKNGLPDKVRNELDKCDLLCANCHRIRHEKGL